MSLSLKDWRFEVLQLCFLCDFTDFEDIQAVCDTKCESADAHPASGTVCPSVQAEPQETVDAGSKSVYYSKSIYFWLSIM